MKLGTTRLPSNVQTLVLPREGADPIVLMASAVTDMDTFDKLCPEPTPPKMIVRGGGKAPNLKDQGYLLSVSQYAANRMNFIILSSLKATQGLEWTTVVEGDPSTWNNWRKDCMDSGLSSFECNRIVNLVVSANGLSDEVLEEAKKSFLASLVVQPE